MADEPTTTLKQVMSFLIRLCQRRFYGEVRIKFQGGQIITIVQEQTFKATDLPTE